MQKFIFHHNELYDFAFELSYCDPLHFQDVDPTLVADKGRTHVEEDFWMEELAVRTIELPQRPAVVEKVTQNFTVQLIVKVHVYNTNFSQLDTELHSTDEIFKVGNGLLKINFTQH